jgi:hypothetical protein
MKATYVRRDRGRPRNISRQLGSPTLRARVFLIINNAICEPTVFRTVLFSRRLQRGLEKEGKTRMLGTIPETARVILGEYLAKSQE